MEGEAAMSAFANMLEARGVTRRDFMKLCGTVAAAAGLSQLTVPQVAQALETSVIGATKGNLYPVIWVEGASCTGCTESFAQAQTPNAAEVVLDMISLNYSETLSAAAGYSMEEAKEQTIEAGDYILIYEGAIQEKWGGNALRVAGKPGTEHLIEAAKNANAVVALGSCAVNGGWMGAKPNVTDAMGVQQYLKKAGINVPVVNVGCPANPEWLTQRARRRRAHEAPKPPIWTSTPRASRPASSIRPSMTTASVAATSRTASSFTNSVPRGEEGPLPVPLGCRGPRPSPTAAWVWNDRRSWCVQAGAPCIGCCEANPNDPGQNWVEVNTPFLKRHRSLHIGDWDVQPTTIAVGVTGLLAAALVVHGFGMKATGRMDGGADFEKKRAWDAKHPEKSVGTYEVSEAERQKMYKEDTGHDDPNATKEGR